MEPERGRPGDLLAGLQPVELGVEEFAPRLERAPEACFLSLDHVDDERLAVGQIGVARTEGLDGGTHQAGHHQALATQPPGVSHRTAQDPPQDVPPAIVRRDDPVGDQHRDRSAVVGEDPQRHVHLG